MADGNAKPPLVGKGLMGWLGRQIGYVSKAVRDPVPPPPPEPVYRREHVEEQPHPDRPDLTLRRTTIDEALPTRRRGDS